MGADGAEDWPTFDAEKRTMADVKATTIWAKATSPTLPPYDGMILMPSVASDKAHHHATM